MDSSSFCEDMKVFGSSRRATFGGCHFTHIICHGISYDKSVGKANFKGHIGKATLNTKGVVEVFLEYLGGRRM